MTHPPPVTDFDYDTITVSEAFPWFKGVAMLLVGCTIAGFAALFDLSFKDLWPPAIPKRQFLNL